MEKGGKDGIKSKLLVNGDQEKVAMNEVIVEEEDESKKLLLSRKGGLSTKSEKKHRKVQWNDTNGNKLTEVLEYQPSEASDSSDDEDSDSCICNIM